MKDKKQLFSLTHKDFEMETFRVGGNGGGRLNSTCTGVRYRHRPSGAVGEGREERMQSQNKKAAFQRCCESPEMLRWLKAEASRRITGIAEEPAESLKDAELRIKKQFDADLRNGLIKIEGMTSTGEWETIQ